MLIKAACSIGFLPSMIHFVSNTLSLPRQAPWTLLITLLVLFLGIIALTFWGLCTSAFLLLLFYDIGKGPWLALFFACFHGLRGAHLVDPGDRRLVRYSGWRLLVLHVSLVDNLDIVARVQRF